MAEEFLFTNFEEVYRDIGLRLDQIGEEVLFEGVLQAFRRDGISWSGKMRKSISGPLSLDGPKRPSASLATRSGESGLKGSFDSRVTHAGSLGSIESRKFTTSPYAITHELGTRAAGGKIGLRPKRARALTIPLEDAMTPSGVPREPSARDWDDTFVFSTPEHTGSVLGFIVKEDPAQAGELLFLYLLFNGEPKIPPRLGMRETHEKGSRKRVDLVAEAIRSKMKSTGKGRR